MLSQGDYHAHIYYDVDSKPIAMEVVQQLEQLFNVEIGHFHDTPVGPHPTGSIQITVGPEPFGTIINWFALNRQGLTIFWHANTGDVMKDHTEHTLWMGSMPELNLDVLRRLVEAG